MKTSKIFLYPLTIPLIITAIFIVTIIFWHHTYIFPDEAGPRTTVNYPYLMIVKPGLASEGQMVSITHSALDPRATIPIPEILVINPSGSKFSSSLSSVTFVNTNVVGNYSVHLISKIEKQILASSSFLVTPFPYAYSLYLFATGFGLPLTVGGIIALLTGLYNFLSTRHADRNLKLKEKSQWIITNSKSYLELVKANKSICDCFIVSRSTTDRRSPTVYFHRTQGTHLVLEFNEKIKNESYQLHQMINKEILFFRILDLYKARRKFREDVGFYYFDNVIAEDFLNHLSAKLLEHYRDEGILLEVSRYFDLEKDLSEEKDPLVILEKQKELDKCKRSALALISDDMFYSYVYVGHLLFAAVLNVCINDGALVAYTNFKTLRKTISHTIGEMITPPDDNDDGVANEIKRLLDSSIKSYNEKFYKDAPFSYELSLDEWNILKDPWWKRNKRGIIVGLAGAFIIIGGYMIYSLLFIR